MDPGSTHRIVRAGRDREMLASLLCDHGEMKKSSKIAIGCVGGFILTVHLLTGSVSRDMGYHCDFTGSTKSWTKWPLGIRTDYNYETSPIENFLATNRPGLIEHKWVSYSGTGKNIFGKPVFWGHGSPNALLLFPRTYLQFYIEQSPKEDVLELYETLRLDDRDEIKLRVEKLHEEIEHLFQKHLQ